MKNLIIILFSLALQSCHKDEVIAVAKNVELDNVFTVSGITKVKVNGQNLEIAFLKFDDYGTTGIQPPFTEVYLKASTESGSSNLSIFHYLRTEKMSLLKLDSISENESSVGISYFHERAIIEGKYALYFKNAYLGSAFKKDKMDYLKVDSASFIITRLK
jgi:hypothetical protein